MQSVKILDKLEKFISENEDVFYSLELKVSNVPNDIKFKEKKVKEALLEMIRVNEQNA